MHRSAVSVVLVVLNFKSNHFNHLQVLQSVRTSSAFKSLRSEIGRLAEYLNKSKKISLKEFDKRFFHIKNLSVELCGSFDTWSFDDLVESIGRNLKKFEFLNEKNRVTQINGGWEKLVKVISREVNQGNKNPVKCLFHQLAERPPRVYNEKESVKILQKLSSQLYHRFRQTLQVSEVQVLHVLDGEKTKYLFFAVNPLDSSDIFQAIKQDWEGHSLIDVVSMVYDQSEGIDNETEKEKMKRRGERSKEYAENLKKLFLDNSGNKNLINFIRNHSSSHQIFNIQYPLLEDGLYLVNPCNFIPEKGYKYHAEEQLCDIVELIEETKTKEKFKYQIYGRKRPCMSCFGRLCYVKYEQKNENQVAIRKIDNEKKEKIDLAFSQHPGFLWITAFVEQPLDVQMSTFKYFISSPSYVSLNKMGNYCFSEGTESDKGSDTLHYGNQTSGFLTNQHWLNDEMRLMNWVMTTHQG